MRVGLVLLLAVVFAFARASECSDSERSFSGYSTPSSQRSGSTGTTDDEESVAFWRKYNCNDSDDEEAAYSSDEHIIGNYSALRSEDVRRRCLAASFEYRDRSANDSSSGDSHSSTPHHAYRSRDDRKQMSFPPPPDTFKDANEELDYYYACLDRYNDAREGDEGPSHRANGGSGDATVRDEINVNELTQNLGDGLRIHEDDSDVQEDSLGECSDEDANPPVSCYDSYGNRVDWWIAYVEGSSGQFVEYTSRDVRDHPDRTAARPMDADRSFFRKNTSPMLRTVYDNLAPDAPLTEVGETLSRDDTRMFLAWNDSQHYKQKKDRTGAVQQDGSPSASGSKKVNDGKQKDMYGWGMNVNVAHSKGMLGLGFNENRMEVSFYLLTHSFPETPNGAAWQSHLPVKRRRPPTDTRKFFGSNITGKKAKAQHAMCMSFTQAVRLNKSKEIVFDASAINHDTESLFAVLDGLSIIQPAMAMTDYDPWSSAHRAYHQLFGVTKAWSGTRWADNTRIVGSNVARANASQAARPSHAFPLWPTANKVTANASGTFTDKKGVDPTEKGYRIHSLRTEPQFDKTRCQEWDVDAVKASIAAGGRFDGRSLPYGKQCFLSVTLRTTARDGSPLTIVADYKHSLASVTVDDILRRHIVSGADVLRARSQVLAPSGSRVPRHNVAIMVAVQSWLDYATYPTHNYTVADAQGYRATAWFVNSAGVRLPAAGGRRRKVEATKDHGKWFVSYLYGTTGGYAGVAGVMDLNRSFKMTQRVGEESGRSGAVYVTADPAVVRFFYSLSPIVDDNAAFGHVDLGVSGLGDACTSRVVSVDADARTLNVLFHDGSLANVRAPFVPFEDPCVYGPHSSSAPGACQCAEGTPATRKWKLGTNAHREDNVTPPRQRDPPSSKRFRGT